jgi:hypothetical protein
MVASKEISFIPLPVQEAIRMHSHGYDFKKRGAFIRIAFRKWRGKPVPFYNCSPGRLPFSRWAMEAVISVLFAVLSTRPARWISEHIPPKVMGKLFESARKKWKKSTTRIKRKQLIES